MITPLIIRVTIQRIYHNSDCVFDITPLFDFKTFTLKVISFSLFNF